jgi:uncharacterized protein
MRRFDLRTLNFGERDETWRRLPVHVEPFVLGGAEYAVDGAAVDLVLTVARVGSRLTLRGAFSATLRGPCERCLGPAAVPLDVQATIVTLRGESEEDEEEEHYVGGNVLQADRWVRDLIGTAMPAKILCREDCKGLCPVCGADLNVAGPQHHHE